MFSQKTSKFCKNLTSATQQFDEKNFSFLSFFLWLIFRVLKPPGGMSSNIFSETESTTSSNESRASSTSPKTPQKVYRMASNFELGDEQPENPTPRRKPFKASGNNNKIIILLWKLLWFSSTSLWFGITEQKSSCELKRF